MSGDFSSVQNHMVRNELIDQLKAFSISQSSNNYAEVMEELHHQLKCMAPNGLKENKPFTFSIVDNFYRIVPILDRILAKKNAEENKNDFIQTNNFLETLANLINDICLFEVFAILKSTHLHQLQTIFQNYILLLKETYFNDNQYDHLLRCLLPIIAYSSVLISITEDQIPANLLTYLLTYTNQYWQCHDRERVIRNILGLIKCFSKKPTLVPMIIRSKWPDACIQWIMIKDVEHRCRPSFIIDYHIFLILHKLARHPMAVQVLSQLNCLKALDESQEQMNKDHNESNSNCLHFLRSMIYALLMEANDIKQMSLLTDSRMCQVLEQLVCYSIEASRTEHLFYQCFHISEILTVLSKLFVNDDILIKCLNENDQLFDCLCQLILHYTNLNNDINRIPVPTDDETLLTLTNLLWSISFHQIYHQKFQKNSILMHTLANLATSSALFTGEQTKSTPRDLGSVKKAAEGILWNLKSSSTPMLHSSTNEKKDQQPLVMISYSHSDSNFCRELVERLSAHVPVWVDYKQAHDAIAHSDDLWEEIARAMEMATIIILIVSKEYYDSKSCRQELSYATDTLKKRIVPIYAPNEKYRASGWLGIRIAGQKYIHFGRKLFADAIKELSTMIVTDQKQLVISAPPSFQVEKLVKSSSETIPVTKIPTEEKKFLELKDWTMKDIQKWFEENHIHQDLITLYAEQFHTGTSLIVYARHLKLFYSTEFIRIATKYQQIFKSKTLETMDFITLVDAFYRLRNEYDPHSYMEDSHEKWNDQQLSWQTKHLEEGMTWL